MAIQLHKWYGSLHTDSTEYALDCYKVCSTLVNEWTLLLVVSQRGPHYYQARTIWPCLLEKWKMRVCFIITMSKLSYNRDDEIQTEWKQNSHENAVEN